MPELAGDGLTIGEAEDSPRRGRRRVAELHVRRGNPDALGRRIMTFSELNRCPGGSPFLSAMAPPRDFINADELAEVICKEIHDQRLRLLAYRRR
jgi:hypothetical protein